MQDEDAVASSGKKPSRWRKGTHGYQPHEVSSSECDDWWMSKGVWCGINSFDKIYVSEQELWFISHGSTATTDFWNILPSGHEFDILKHRNDTANQPKRQSEAEPDFFSLTKLTYTELIETYPPLNRKRLMNTVINGHCRKRWVWMVLFSRTVEWFSFSSWRRVRGGI